MSTQIRTDATTRTGEQHQTTDDTSEPTPTSSRTESWTSRCGAPMTFDPSNGASMGQFDTTPDEPQ